MKPLPLAAIALLAAVAIGTAALAWRQHRELIQLRGSALTPNERADLQKRIWDLDKSNRDLADELAALRATADDDAQLALDGAPMPGAESSTVERATRGERGGGRQRQFAWREAMSRPEVQAAMNLQRKLGIEQRYGALFRTLNATPEQAEQLKALLAERQTTLQDILMIAREEGINPRRDREAFQKLVADAHNEIDAGIRSVIGDAGLAQLQNYEQTLPQRAVVNDLQQRLSYSDTPLTAAQAEQLVQTLAANSPARANNSGNPSTNAAASGLRADFGALAGLSTRGGSVPITTDAINQAQGFLAESQVNALRQLRRQQQAQQDLQRLMRETMQQNRNPRPPPTAPTGGQ